MNFIEDGNLEIGLWCTYTCPVNCLHCYLKSSVIDKTEDLTVENYNRLLDSILEYRKTWNKFGIIFYGAEPQTLLPSYYLELISNTRVKFNDAHFGMYTSLQKMDKDWINTFKAMGSKVTVSYDVGLRSIDYNKNLFKNINILNNNDIIVDMISVMNKTMVNPIDYVDMIDSNNINRFSIKPFLLVSGQKHIYDEWHVTNEKMSEFLIDVHIELLKRNELHKSAMIDKLKSGDTTINNLGGYALFADGGLRILSMEYNEDREEFLQEFGRITDDISFSDIVNGEKRKAFLDRQRMFNYSTECMLCEYPNKCYAEVFKLRFDDSIDCFGTKRFIQWVHDENII